MKQEAQINWIIIVISESEDILNEKFWDALKTTKGSVSVDVLVWFQFVFLIFRFQVLYFFLWSDVVGAVGIIPRLEYDNGAR